MLKKFFNFISGNKNEEYNPAVVFLNDLQPGDKVGLVGSSHGNIIALTHITELLKKNNVKYIFHLGDIMDEHAGYIECLEYVVNEPLYKPVVGNHDLLIINKDAVHNYEKEYVKLAEKAMKKFLSNDGLYDSLMNMPSKIETNFFGIVHESVKYPYYAKITKLKKKSNVYGKTSDENLESVFNSSLGKPYFTGSDHQAYVISGVKLQKRFMLPNEKINVRGSAIISLPSVSLSKDTNYTHGFCIAECEDDKSITVEFRDLPDILINGGDIL
jgi:hypothetical protein